MAVNLDPTVERAWWKIREYWRVVRGPCGICGGEIDYDGPRYTHVIKGDKLVRVENTLALDVGHIVERDLTRGEGKRIPYPTGRIAPIETQPEHALCNRSRGARYGNRKRQSREKPANFNTSRKW